MTWSEYTAKVLLKDKGRKGRIYKAFRDATPFLVKEYFPVQGQIAPWAEAEIRFGQHESEMSGLQAVFSEGESIYLVYAWIEGINLQELKDRHRFWKKRLPYAMLFQKMAKAVEALHRKGYLHLDIRPSNFIYASQTETIHLIDFGSIRSKAELASGLLPEFGMHYASPELLLKKAAFLNEQSDYYGFGLSMAYLITGKHPFSDQHPEIIKSRMVSENLNPQDYGIWGELILALSYKKQMPKPPAQLSAQELEFFISEGKMGRTSNLEAVLHLA